MTNHTENTQNSLVVPIISAFILIVGVAALVWATQVRPTVQAAQANGLPGVNEALAKSGRQEPFPTDASLLRDETPATQAETVSVSVPDHPILGDPAAGETLFTGTCSACHGPAGEGISGLGKDLTASPFIIDKVDQELIDFIKVGRDPSDPLNTTGIGMPPKGGNPSLDDEDLQNIISYIRTLQKS